MAWFRYKYSAISLLIFAVEIFMVTLCLNSVVDSAGSSDLWVGCVGLFSFLMGLLGFHMARLDRRVQGKKANFPLFMMTLHGVVLLLSGACYVLGLLFVLGVL